MFSSVIALLALSAGVAQANLCKPDVCILALEAYAFFGGPAKSDCSSFLRTTVTPATVTVTATATHTSNVLTSVTTTSLSTTTTVVPTLTTQLTTVVSIETDSATTTVLYKKRNKEVANGPKTVCPSKTPIYANPCQAPARYSSACECIGVHPTIVTAQAPSTTVTATKTNTVISTLSSTKTSVATVTAVTTITTLQTITSQSTTTTTYTTSSSTTSSAAPVNTACNSAQYDYCFDYNASNGGVCDCAIEYVSGSTLCFGTAICPNSATAAKPACSTDSDCNSVRQGTICVYDDEDFCPGGRFCAEVDSCPQNIPQKLKRDLEEVFERAGVHVEKSIRGRRGLRV